MTHPSTPIPPFEQGLENTHGVKRRSVVVVGAGPAGLAVSACLSRAGIDHEVLEQAHEVGSSWRRHYHRLHLHTVKRHSALPYLPWPEESPIFPSRDDVVRYLEGYAAHFEIQPRFGVTVRSVFRHRDRWRIQTTAGAWSARCLVWATGFNRIPVRPAFDGVAEFEGSMVHSGEYRDGESYRGQNVLVVGSGNSGAEIAVDLHEHGARPTLVARSPVHVAKRTFWGLHAQESAIRLARLPNALADIIMRIASRLGLGNLRPYGLIPPAMGPMTQIKTRGRIPIIDVGLVPLVKAGQIEVVPGIAHFGARTVTLVDGTTRDIEAVVLATGYRTGLQKLFRHPRPYLDDEGRPRAFGAEVANARVFFLGFANPPTGALREIALEAPRVAQRIADILGAADYQPHQLDARGPESPLHVTKPKTGEQNIARPREIS